MNNYRRYNPLTGDWVVVAANRVNRPWAGATTGCSKAGTGFQQIDAVNQLAPGGVRANEEITPQYTSTYVFENDFPSFTNHKDSCDMNYEDGDLFRQQEIRGTCRVICYHPDTEKTLATMSEMEVLEVVKVWMQQFKELKEIYTWVQIFENRGAAVGCSNAHPHGQLWASDFLPTIPSRKDANQKTYYEKNGRVLLLDYLEQEAKKAQRIVLRNEHWTVLVPYWAVWPFETLLIPNRHVRRMDDLNEDEQISLAKILKTLVIKYDNIFQCTFPYSMGWSSAPTGPNSESCDHWQLHAAFHPPLLRSANVPKYLAGYEVFAEPQRDILPEKAAEVIREQSDKHYSLHDI